MRNGLIAFLLLSLLVSGCTRQQVWESEVVARVGDRKLTASEISAWEASLNQAEIPQEARSTFIRHWVEEELLYQEALEQGLDSDAWVAGRLDEIMRDLLIARLLETRYEKIVTPSAAAIKTYFDQNASEFTWPHLHLEVEYWRSEDRRSLERLRSNVQRGRQAGIWTGKAGTLENGRIALNGRSSTIPEVWDVVSRMSVGEVSTVRHIDDNFWVFKLIDRRESGEQQGLEDVRDEIKMRLVEQARANARENAVRKLVDKYRHSGKLYWSTQSRAPSVPETGADSQVTGGE